MPLDDSDDMIPRTVGWTVCGPSPVDELWGALGEHNGSEENGAAKKKGDGRGFNDERGHIGLNSITPCLFNL